MNQQLDHVQATGLLATYAAGTLSEADRSAVAAHLQTCASCRSSLEDWNAVRRAVRATAPAVAPGAAVLAGVYQRLTPRRSATGLLFLLQLVRSQVSLVRKAIWLASPATLALGCLVAFVLRTPDGGGLILAALSPLVAALGIAFICEPENDPALEIARATPTSPQRVLLTRLLLVYGYDLVLALVATMALAAGHTGMDLVPLISLWLGPMFFLSGLALVLSLSVGASNAAVSAMCLWVLRLLVALERGAASPLLPPLAALNAFWHANALLIFIGVLMLAGAIWYAPRRELESL